MKALEMYWQGHRDIIDNILYTTALTHNLRLLTVDDELIEFVKKNNLPTQAIITPEAL